MQMVNRFHIGQHLRAYLFSKTSFVHALRPSQQVSNHFLTQWVEPELGRELGAYGASRTSDSSISSLPRRVQSFQLSLNMILRYKILSFMPKLTNSIIKVVSAI